MAEQSLGNIILRLLVDNKAFKEGLVNALQMVQITSQQIKDLSQFKIDAPDVKALDLALESGQARIKDFIGAEEMIPEVAPSVDHSLGESGKKHDEHSEKVLSGEQAVRRFLAENRLQDRVLGETKNSVVGITGAFIPLVAGQGSASEASKLLSESFVRGIETSNQLEFALFGIGQVGTRLPGIMGAVASSVGAFAGPIALAVGAGAALIMFMDSANEKSKKLSEEGLQAYLEKIKEAGGGNVLFLKEIERSLEAQKKSLEDIKEISRTATYGGVDPAKAQTTLDLLRQQSQAAGDVTSALARSGVARQLESQDEKHKKIIEDLQTEIEKQQVLSDAIDKANKDIKANGDEYRRLKVEVEELTKQIETQDFKGAEGERKRQSLIDERIAKQERLHLLTQSTFELAQEEIGLLEQKRNIGEATTREILAQIDAALQGNVTEKQRVELLNRRYSLEKSVADESIAIAQFERELGRGSLEDVLRALEAKRALVKSTQERLEIEKLISDEYRKQGETEFNFMQQMRRAREEFNDKLFELTQTAMQSEFAARDAAEKRRYEQERKNIIEKYATIGVYEDGQVHLSQEGQQLLAENDLAHQRVLALTEQDRLRAKREIENAIDSDSLEAQIRNINASFDEEERLARQVFTDKNELDAVLAQLRKARDREVANAELANTQRVLGAAQSIVGNIISISRALDEPAEGFLANLQKALSVAQTIVATIQAINSISSFFGLFEQGGAVPVQYAASGMEIPGGSFVVKKSAADANKPLLQALGAKEVTGGTPGKDSVLARTDSGMNVMMMPGEMIVAPQFAPIAAAINAGRRMVMRANGGAANDWFSPVISAVQQYYNAGLAPGTIPISRNVLEEIQLQMNGGFNKDVVDALIEEVRKLNDKVDVMSNEIRNQTSELPDRINMKFPESIEMRAEGRELRAVIRRDQMLDQ